MNRNNQDRIYLEITHFVNLFADTFSTIKYNEKVKKEFIKNRVQFERAKMEAGQRKAIEDREKQEYIDQWKLKNKMKHKKPGHVSKKKEVRK